jgi:xylono-1,5-lactonase
MALPVRCVDPAAALLGEGPVWVAREQALYWTDIIGCRIHRFEPASGARASWPTPFRVTSLAPRSRGGFVAGSEHGFALIDAALGQFDIVADPEPDLPENRFNDGKTDQAGRFWAGTMDDAERQRSGALYRLDPDLRWSCHDRGYVVANGPAFTPDGQTMYHTDSATRTVFRFRIDEQGRLHDKAVFVRFEEADGHPDGMTADSEGCLWIAFWDGWCVRRLSPGAEVMELVELPVQRPTSCAFGGADLSVLFVTSASTGIEVSETCQPLAGGLFAFEPGVRGVSVPEFRT